MSLLIVGGGATGLAAAYLAAKRGETVTLVEASDRVGGLLSTFDVGGTKLECFYHHFFTHDEEINQLLKELDLADRIHYVEAQMGMYCRGKILPFATTKDLLFFPYMGLLDKIRFGLTSLFLAHQKSWQKFEDISALAWFYKWAGKRATEVVWRPMLEIKFGEYADRVPVAWMIGRMTQRLKSRSKGQEKLGYLRGSLQLLVDRLEDRLTELGVKIIKNSPVTQFLFQSDRMIGVQTPQGNLFADQTLVTIPTVRWLKFLPDQFAEYRRKIEQIKYFGVICGVVVSQKALSDIYWLNVADPGFSFGGVIEQTNFVPASEYQGKHITYLSRYVTLNDPLFAQSDAEVSTLFHHQLESIFPDLAQKGIEEIKIFRSSTAATVCDLNFSQKVPAYKSPIAGLFVANMAHIYPDERSVNNSIKVAINLDTVLQRR